MNYITTPQQAEQNAAAVMRRWGYVDAVATTGGADGGIDVRSSRALAQVKWKGGVAGSPDMNRLFGARGNDTSKQLFFFVASGYSKAAVQYADQVGIALFTYNPVGEVEASNKVAKTFIQTNDGRAKVSFKGMNLKRVVLSSDVWFLGFLLVALGVVFAILRLTNLL